MKDRYSDIPLNIPLEDDEITSPDGTACADLKAIHEIMSQLGPDERRLVIDCAQGMLNGHPEYGEFRVVADQRDRVVETYEEIRDAINHIGMHILRLRKQ